MFVSFNTSSADFIAELRTGAIKSGLPPQVIAKIDELDDIDELQAEIEKVGDELSTMEKDRDNLGEELVALLEFLPRLLNAEEREDVSALEMNTVFRSCLNALQRNGWTDESMGDLARQLGFEL